MLKTLYQTLNDRFKVVSQTDGRSCQFVAVIECILNQNARDAGAAAFPAMNLEIVQLCNTYNIGILQIPCPEINFLGFKRKRQKGQSIREALDIPAGRKCCREISIDIADRIEEYLAQNYQIISILAGNEQSPGCAVHYVGDKLSSASGILMHELHDELGRRSINVPFKGIRDNDPELFAKDIEWVRRLFFKSKNSFIKPNT